MGRGRESTSSPVCIVRAAEAGSKRDGVSQHTIPSPAPAAIGTRGPTEKRGACTPPAQPVPSLSCLPASRQSQ